MRAVRKDLFKKGKKDEMRADRLLSMLLLLQTHRRMTVRELAQRLEVSVRTVYRDMEALNTAGIPITAERGADGGWFLLDGYRTNLTGLNEPEVHALFVPRPSPILDDLGLRKAAEGAFIKLLAALPVLFRRNAEEIRQRIHIDAAGWDRLDEQAPWLPLLQEAVWQERKLFLSYRRRDESVMDYLVDPLGPVAKASIWYLVGLVEQAYRVFRVSRIQSARITDQPCIRPASFDLARPFSIWVPAISKHLRVLEQAELILHRKEGRTHRFRLAAGPPKEAAAWLEHYRHFWEAQLDSLDTYLQIVPPEKLVFTWSAGAAPGRETVVTLDFLDLGEVTELILTHEHLVTPERHAVAEGGWSSLFDALASALSSRHLDW
jgi:predicted DNA-binding transcriptional regulator YafY